MNSRTHLTLVPAAPSHTPSGTTPAPLAGGPARALDGRRARHAGTGRPAGGRAAGVAALGAGLTLGLALGAIATLTTHPGDFAALLLPVAGAAGITIAAAMRSRMVAQKRRRMVRARMERDDLRRRAMRPRPVLIHSRDQVPSGPVAVGSVATPIRRAA